MPATSRKRPVVNDSDSPAAASNAAASTVPTGRTLGAILTAILEKHFAQAKAEILQSCLLGSQAAATAATANGHTPAKGATNGRGSAKKTADTNGASADTAAATAVVDAATAVAAAFSDFKLFIIPEAVHVFCQLSDAPVDTPFDGDSSFVQGEECWSSIRSWALVVRNLGIGGAAEKLLQHSRVATETAADALDAATNAVRHYVDARCGLMKRKPRAVLLSERLLMTPVEKLALMHILVLHCGATTTFATGISLAPNSIARVCNMSMQELAEFSKEQRPHAKQGVVVFCETRQKMSFNDMRFKMPMEVVSALCGAELTEEQLIKLERTALCDVVREDLRARDAMAPPASRLPPRAEFPATNPNDASADGAEDGDGAEGDDGSGGDWDEDEGDDDEGAAVRRTRRRRSGGGGDGPSYTESAPASPTWTAAGSSEKMNQPYTSDMMYMDDMFKLLATLIKVRNAEADVKDEDDDYFNPKNKAEATLRELRGRERILGAVIQSRMEATRKQAWQPRVEQLCVKLGLDETERRILLLMVGNVVSHDILIAVNGRYVMRGDGQREFTVGYLLFVLFGSLEDRVKGRKCFYSTSSLMKHGLISITIPTAGRNAFNTDLTDYLVDVDRRIVDHVMGLETEPSEMVQGSRVYTPTVPLENVVLPPDTTKTVISTIEHFAMLASCKKKCGFNQGMDSLENGGLVLLFYGPSGTGKTMLANAIAMHLKKKVLLVNAQHFASLTASQGHDVLRYIFREARLSDAVVFFDECESIFAARESNPMLTSILPEFEKYDGVVILATNRAQTIDEAMNRRISLMVEFTLPDHQMREKIWRAHLPKNLTLNPCVSVENIALDYELTGGLIKNAVLAALSAAVAREQTDSPSIHMHDLVTGAKTQLRGLFQAADPSLTKNQSAYLTPRRGLADVVLPDAARQHLQHMIKITKSRHTMYTQWGFDQQDAEQQNAIILFSGPSGTGKSLCAEAMAFECGLTMRLTNTASLLHSREAGPEVHRVFEEARALGAAVVFDQAQGLFEHTERATQLGQLIQYLASSFARPVFVIAETSRDGISLDVRASSIRFTEEMVFGLPGKALRKKLWESFLPAKVPRGPEGIDFDALSNSANVSARMIKTVCFACCAKVALRPEAERLVATADLLDELRLQQEMERRRASPTSMFV